MNKKLYYLTYQDFPANTANSQQTIGMCKYFVRNKYEVSLFFPLRSKHSDDNLMSLKKHYEFSKEIFDVVGIHHKTKFEGSNHFKKIRYIFGHILWAKNSVKKILKEFEVPSIFFTRSDWVFYFLSKKNKPVVFECHKLTSIRKKILQLSIKKEFSKIIFVNDKLKIEANIKSKYFKKLLVQGAGYDQDFFYESDKKIIKQIVYAGSLQRLGLNRNLDYIIDSFSDKRMSDFNLKIFGGTEKEIALLKRKYKHIPNVKFSKHITKTSLGKEFAESEIGILAGSNDVYSKYYTDPLKFYEYVAAGLKIIATNFPSHRNLEKYSNITFFNYKDSNSFINSVLQAHKNDYKKQVKNVSTLDSRVKNIINFIS